MVQSIDRAMKIIEIIVSDPTKSEWSISELAEETNLPVSTMHRLLSSLIQHGLVAQVAETKRYKAGSKWMEIGLRLLENMDIREVAKPIMERLALEVEENIYLNIPSGVDAIVIEKIDSPLKVRIAENLGLRIPLNIGAPNKTILAYMDAPDRKKIIDYLMESEQSRDLLEDQLADIRMQGYAISRGEKTEGTASVAAPIIGFNKKILAALSINGPSFRLTEERMPVLIHKIRQAAEEISMKIGRI